MLRQRKRHSLRKCGTWWYDKYNGIYHPHPQPNGHEPYLKRERVIQPIKYAEHHLSTQDGPWWFFFLHPQAPSKWEKRRSKTSHRSARVTVTSKLGIAVWGAAPRNRQKALLTVLFPREGPQAHPQTAAFPFLDFPRNALPSFRRASFQVGSD